MRDGTPQGIGYYGTLALGVRSTTFDLRREMETKKTPLPFLCVPVNGSMKRGGIPP